MDYGGSRKRNQRFEYSESSTAAFVELSPQHTPSEEDLFEQLQQVPGVDKVEWHKSKTSQGSLGSHFSERNILVYSILGGPPIEFQITRHNHFKNNEDLPFTVTVSFKAPRRSLIPDAWRILRAATEGQQLFPDHVQEYHERNLNRLGLGANFGVWDWEVID